MNVVAIYLLLYGLSIHSKLNVLNSDVRTELERGLPQRDFPLDAGLLLFSVDPGVAQQVVTHT